MVASRNELGNLPEALLREDRCCPVPTGQIALGDRFVLARIEVAQGEQAGRALVLLLGEPDLIAPEDAVACCIAEQRDVMGVENELSPIRVGLLGLKQANELGSQGRVQARVEFIHEQYRSVR